MVNQHIESTVLSNSLGKIGNSYILSCFNSIDRPDVKVPTWKGSLCEE
jgi:hypothetical protein